MIKHIMLAFTLALIAPSFAKAESLIGKQHEFRIENGASQDVIVGGRPFIVRICKVKLLKGTSTLLATAVFNDPNGKELSGTSSIADDHCTYFTNVRKLTLKSNDGLSRGNFRLFN
ncbi:hypothetical protein V5T82_01445 [Magnetovibrio sp. PR-2]|uniref:hypothetical protein n=1 Tax=Magnetovibrio sp. PR-2 TaxID=3120356 RepID=UPI002FCE136E